MAVQTPKTTFVFYSALALALVVPHVAGSSESDHQHRHSNCTDDEHHGEHSDPAASLTVLVIALGAGLISAVPLKDTHLPYTVLLLLLGCLLGVIDKWAAREGQEDEWYPETAVHISVGQWTNIDPHLILYCFLPILIYESAYNCSWHIFATQLGQIVTLAVPGVIMCTMLTATVVKYLYDFDDWNACFMIGAMLSATDPVAVVALMKELGASSRLSTLIEGESLLNDGTSIVIFNVFKDAVTGEAEIEAGPVAAEFVKLSFGGVAVGLILAVTTVFLLGRLHNDVSGEITLTLVAAFGTFIVAEAFETSGVLALVALGLYMSAYGRLRIEPAVEHVMEHFWELAGYFANTIVFFISGVIVVQRGIVSEDIHWDDVGLLLVVYVALHAIRGLMLLCASPLLMRMGYGFDWQTGVALGYGGLRGAVGLTLAMIVEEDQRIDSYIRSKAIFLMSGIALLTLLVNGTTVGYVLRKIGLIHVSEAAQMAFNDRCQELETEVEADLAKILEHNRFLGGVTNKSSMVQVYQYLAIHTKTSYQRRVEKYGAFEPAPRLKGRWKRYHEHYNPEKERRFVSTEMMPSGTSRSASSMERNPLQSPMARLNLSIDDVINDDEKKAIQGEMRSRFVRALKTQIWVLIEEGFLDSAHGGLLLDIVEQHLDIDMVENELDTFQLIKVMIDKSIVMTLSSRSFLRLLNVNGLRSMLKDYVHKELGSLFALLSGFVMAHEKALHHIIDIHKMTHPEGGDAKMQSQLEKTFAHQLHKEVMRNTRDFEQYADNYMHDYPAIMMSIKIKAAARVMLAIERHKIEHLHHSGIIDAREAEILQSANNVSTTKVGYHPSSIAVLSKNDYLRGHTMTQTLSQKVIAALVNGSKEHYYKPEAKLLVEGTSSDEWMILVSGTVRCVHECGDDGGEEELLRLEGPNAVVGVNGVLTGNLRASTVIAQSFVQAYYWTTETSRQLMVEFPELGLALWQSVALFVCEVCVTPFEGIEPSALMSMVRQGELWSHSKSPAKVYAAAYEAAVKESGGLSSISSSSRRLRPKMGARTESKRVMKSMKDFENCNRDRSTPEEIELTTYGLLLTGAVRKRSAGGWMRGYRLLHPDTYMCDDETTIMRLLVMLPEAEEALRAHDWSELDEHEDNLDGRSSRYSVAQRQSISRISASSFTLKEGGSIDATDDGIEQNERTGYNRKRSVQSLDRQESNEEDGGGEEARPQASHGGWGSAPDAPTS